MDIPLERIDPPANSHLDQSSIDEMVQMLQANGLPKPILVRSVRGRYAILDGARRYLAAKQLGWETIAVRVKGQPQPSNPLVAEIAQTLNEPMIALINQVVKILGEERTRAFLQQTLEIEANDGLLTTNGDRRRTAGGVFLYLVRKGVSQSERQAIFQPIPQRKESHHPTALKKQTKPPAERLVWSDALKYVNALHKHEKGMVHTVEVKLIGRPAKVAKAKTCMVAMMERKNVPDSLPEGIPVPPEQVQTFTVFISNKQWHQVSEPLKTNTNAKLLIRGHPVFNPEKATTILLAQSVEVIERKAKKPQEPMA